MKTSLLALTLTAGLISCLARAGEANTTAIAIPIGSNASVLPGSLRERAAGHAAFPAPIASREPPQAILDATPPTVDMVPLLPSRPIIAALNKSTQPPLTLADVPCPADPGQRIVMTGGDVDALVVRALVGRLHEHGNKL